MQQSQDLVFPGLLDLSSLNLIPRSKEIDLSRMADSKNDVKPQIVKRTSKVMQQTQQVGMFISFLFN